MTRNISDTPNTHLSFPIMAVSTLPPAPIQPTQSSWTFTQGFILGQASFLLIVLLFIRYVVFSPAETPDDEGYKQRRAEKAKVCEVVRCGHSGSIRDLHHNLSNNFSVLTFQRAQLSTTGVPPPPPGHILNKTGYDMATHPAESTDWLNALFAQVSRALGRESYS